MQIIILHVMSFIGRLMSHLWSSLNLKKVWDLEYSNRTL